MITATEPEVIDGPPRPVAAVITEWRLNSHADVLLSRLLEPAAWGHPRPFGLRLASVYADQFPARDLCRKYCETHGVPVFPTVREAVGVETAGAPVEGVLLVGEHGDYPSNRRGQKLYPRRRLFEDVVHAFRRAGRRVPVFIDKHLSYDGLLSRWMYDLARHEGIPLMAGSSIPVAWRSGSGSLPIGARLEEAFALGYSDIEAYGFHALEGLQCQVERRAGGGRGPRRVRCLSGEDVWGQLGAGGRWEKLLAAVGPARQSLDAGRPIPPIKPTPRDSLFVLDYEGLPAAVAMLDGVGECFAFSGRLPGREPEAVVYALEEGRPFGHFGHLLRAVERMVVTGRPAYPVERTLVTSCALDALLQSRQQGGAWVETPHLAAISYSPADWPYAAGPRGTPA